MARETAGLTPGSGRCFRLIIAVQHGVCRKLDREFCECVGILRVFPDELVQQFGVGTRLASDSA